MEPQDGGFRDPRPAADLRDRAGQQRDDAADARDEVSGTRDEAAATRDRAARARDVTAGHDADGVLDRFGRLRGRIVERLRRIEDDDVDPAQWRGLDVGTLARLRTEAAGRRRGVAQDRLDLEALMDELVGVLTRGRGDRDSGAGDRQ